MAAIVWSRFCEISRPRRAVIGVHGAIVGNRRANAALFCGSAALTIYLGFEAGGFFPGSTAVAAVGVAVVLILRVALARDPFGGLNWRSVLAVASLGLFAIWTLVSSTWSHTPGRAVIEFDRVLFYLVVLVLFASLPRREGGRSALAGGFGLGSVVLCVTGFATRTLPAVFPVSPGIANERLAYPLTYWNALGLLAVLGTLICLGLSSSQRLPRAIRALPAGAVPMVGATLVLTFSRGAIAAGLIGLAVLGATCCSRELFFTLLATAPTTGIAIGAAYSATALATADPTGPTAVSQGHHVVVVVALTSLAALLLRALLTRWDRRAHPTPILGPRARQAATALAALVLVVAGGGAAVAFDLPHQVSRQYQLFVTHSAPASGQLLRARLLDPANSGRVAFWRVAVSTWKAQPVHGTGAGTYQNQWNRKRDEGYDVVNTHSLYLEVLADLGLLGLALLLVCLLGLLSGLVMRIRGSDRAITAGLLAAAAAWLVHAGVDWDWQMPVLTWWLFAAGGLALARGGARGARVRAPGQLGRVLVMLGIGIVAVFPVQVGLSQMNLARAVRAFHQGNCNAAVSYSLKSTGDIGARAEPYEVIGYCDARYGHRALAIVMIQNAINRDPTNWEFRYDMAIVRAMGGLDPRSDARQALALNPREPLTTLLSRTMRTSNPRVWRAHAAKVPLLIG